MKKIYTFILMIGLALQPTFAQTNSYGGFVFDFGFNFDFSNTDFSNTNLNINIGNNFNLGNFDFSNINANNCCEEQPLGDIYFGYDIGSILAASALIQKARENELKQWFDRQHAVLKEEIERQLGQSFSNYNEARNTYFKYHEKTGIQRNHSPIESRYNSRILDKENKKSISLKNLKLLRLRENELKTGNLNNSSYGNFTYNGTSLDQIQSLSQLQNLWRNELSTFSNIHWRHHNDYYTYAKIRSIGFITNYNDPLFIELFNKQLAYYNQFDDWDQLDLMQSFLNRIRPPLEYPAGYISPQTYATQQYLENYAIRTKTGGRSIFDPYFNMYGPFYYLWLGRENRTEAIWQVNRYRTLRSNELNRLLNEVEIKPCAGDPVPNPEIAPQTNSGIQGGMHDTCARKNKKYICKSIRGSKWHNGVDIKNPFGAPIFAIYDGNATKQTQRDDEGKLTGAGYYVAIVSQVNGKRVRLVFFHLQEDNRITGNIQAGDIIGYQGVSGNLKSGIADGYTESHVHIKAQENGAPVNPLNHFNTKIDPITGQVTNPCN